MAEKPRWKEAQELAARYREYGVQYCYNDRNHNVYLSLLAAPTCVPNVEGCQLTGYLIIYGGVVESRNIDACIEKLISSYKKAFTGNEVMLECLEPVINARRIVNAKSTNVKEWYRKTYPGDDIVIHLRDELTFWELFEALDNYREIYAVIFKDGWEDSIVRERCFEQLAKIMEVPYDEIFRQWLIGTKTRGTQSDIHKVTKGFCREKANNMVGIAQLRHLRISL